MGLTTRMAQDVFSLGCVIAELFLDGRPLFDLSKASCTRALESSSLHASLPLHQMQFSA